MLSIIINPNGSAEIPVEALKASGMPIGERLEIDYGDGVITIRRPKPQTTLDGVRKAQAMVRQYIKAGGPSLADELIADRRAEAARENAE
jgi:bifunctional DNA-binding transcriptional regulator/antitoxin component of YhaV-PrlF toxin-antitoxin module